MEVLRRTKSVCPLCMLAMDADIVEEQGRVYLVKTCRYHGASKVLVSEHAQDYRELNDLYFGLAKGGLTQWEYYVPIHNACGLGCSVCFLKRVGYGGRLTSERILEFCKDKTFKRVTFSHGEPTESEELFSAIDACKQARKMVNMHTNGLRLADPEYVKSLKAAGMDHVSVQFDSFDEQVCKALRGSSFLGAKLRALENLKSCGIPVTLNVTVAKGVNEKAVGEVFDYALRENFVKDISYITYSHYDPSLRVSPEYLMPDALLDIFEKHTNGSVSRKNIILFQRLFYIYLGVFKKRKCFYYFHYLVVRFKGRYLPIDAFFDLKRALRLLGPQNKKKASKFLFFAYMLLSLRLKSLFLIPSGIRLLIRGGYPEGFTRFLTLTFATVCDPFKYDEDIAGRCGQGIVVSDGLRESYAVYLMEELRKHNPVP